MKKAYKCPIDGCGAKTLEVGLNFHIKSKHGSAPKVEPKPKPKPTPKKEKVVAVKVKKNLKKSAYPLRIQRD